MKNIVLSAFFALLIVACVTKEATDKKKDSANATAETSACCAEKQAPKSCCSKSTNPEALTVSVDELLANPEKYLDKKIDMSGLVVHTCKKSGKKMFMIGSNDSISVKVVASEKISKFDLSLEGSKVIASGMLSVITHDDHGHDHAEGEVCASEAKGKDFVLTCEEFKKL